MKDKTDSRKRLTGDSDIGVICQELCSIKLKNFNKDMKSVLKKSNENARSEKCKN